MCRWERDVPYSLNVSAAENLRVWGREDELRLTMVSGSCVWISCGISRGMCGPPESSGCNSPCTSRFSKHGPAAPRNRSSPPSSNFNACSKTSKLQPRLSQPSISIPTTSSLDINSHIIIDARHEHDLNSPHRSRTFRAKLEKAPSAKVTTTQHTMAFRGRGGDRGDRGGGFRGRGGGSRGDRGGGRGKKPPASFPHQSSASSIPFTTHQADSPAAALPAEEEVEAHRAVLHAAEAAAVVAAASAKAVRAPKAA